MTARVPEFDPVAFAHWKERDVQECWAMCVADCDDDGTDEIILTGWAGAPPDQGGPRSLGELRVIRFHPPDRLVQAARTDWLGYGVTAGHAVCAADVDLDGKTEIVVAGSTYTDRYQSEKVWAHLRIMSFDGRTFTTKDELTWRPDKAAIENRIKAPVRIIGALLNSVTVADIDGDGQPEIVCGGTVAIWVGVQGLKQQYVNLGWIEVYDWTRPAATRREPKYRHMFWDNMHGWAGIPLHDTRVTDIACADIDADGAVEIVTVGSGDYSAELRAWGLRTGDSGPELYIKAQRDWLGLSGHTDMPDTIRHRLVIDDLLGEGGGLDIATGGRAYIKKKTRTPTFPKHSENRMADMRLWRPLGGGFNEITGDLFSFRHSNLDFHHSGCRAVCTADIDQDNITEVLSLHEVAPPVGGYPMYGTLIAWNPRADWNDPRRERPWKRKLTYGIEDDSGNDLETKASGVWAGDIDHDGQVETVVAGFYSRNLKRGVYVGLLR